MGNSANTNNWSEERLKSAGLLRSSLQGLPITVNGYNCLLHCLTGTCQINLCPAHSQSGLMGTLVLQQPVGSPAHQAVVSIRQIPR